MTDVASDFKDLEDSISGLAEYLRSADNEHSEYSARADALWDNMVEMRREYSRELTDD
jgi:hypothetical protein